jgi:preprotein translocase subunit SecF
VISLSVYGLRLGIDFKGGTITELQFKENPDVAKVREAIAALNVGSFQLQTAGEKSLIIRTGALEKEKTDQILEATKRAAGEYTETSFESVGPTVGKELTKNAIYQLLLVSLGIVLYLAYAFRKVPKPVTSWRFGWSAVIALLHDLLFVLGVFSILGHYKGIEIDSLFVTAMLTVLGFSVHDTIVVFDRVRENLKVYAGHSIDFVIGHSISQTIVRSIATSVTVALVLLALLLFGGESIHNFVLALLIGIVVGTYSSIFIASPVLMLWQRSKSR